MNNVLHHGALALGLLGLLAVGGLLPGRAEGIVIYMRNTTSCDDNSTIFYEKRVGPGATSSLYQGCSLSNQYYSRFGDDVEALTGGPYDDFWASRSHIDFQFTQDEDCASGFTQADRLLEGVGIPAISIFAQSSDVLTYTCNCEDGNVEVYVNGALDATEPANTCQSTGSSFVLPTCSKCPNARPPADSAASLGVSASLVALLGLAAVDVV